MKGAALPLIALALACGGSKPTIASFTTSPAAIAAGDSATLTWEVRGADSIALEPGGAQSGAQRMVSPTSTTIYTLVAKNGHGETRANATVAVTSVQQARLSATPTRA